MSLPAPLSVRLRTSRGDRHVTAQLRDLSYRAAIPGGFASARFAFNASLAVQPAEIDYYSRAWVYDAAGEVMWEGRLEDPGRGAGNDGEIYTISALGPSGHARDRTVPLVYIDSEYAYQRVDNQTAGGQNSVGASPGDAAGLDPHVLLQLPNGLAVVTGSRVTVRYNRIFHAGQKLARVALTWDAGVSDSNHNVEAVTRTDGDLSGGEVAATANLSTAGGTLTAVITTDFPSTRNTVEFRQFRDAGGAATIPSDNYWVAIKAVTVQATRYNTSGAELTAAADYTTNYVLAHQVVQDLLGRLLTGYDGASAAVTTTTHQITQLSYPDGVTAERVLADLMLLETGLYWAAWESTAAGKHRFEWSAWPSTVRFDADVADGFDSPASADGLYDRVTVRWVDSFGQIRTTVRTQTVQALVDAGYVRQGFIDLGTDVASQASAERAGDQWLAEHAAAPNRGTLTIARPVMDYVTGRPVMPWELPRRAPGSLIRVRGVQPRIDALNASTRDGVTVFRCISAEFSASRMSCQLELDSPAPNLARTIGDIISQPRPRRR